MSCSSDIKNICGSHEGKERQIRITIIYKKPLKLMQFPSETASFRSLTITEPNFFPHDYLAHDSLGLLSTFISRRE